MVGSIERAVEDVTQALTFFKNKAEEDNFEGCGTRRPERILKEREYALNCLELREMLLEERSGIEN